MAKVVFAGCSFTAGTGWTAPPANGLYKNVDCKDYPGLWVNLCHQNIDALKKLELVNLSHGGGSNTEIFENVMKEISNELSDIKYLLVQWTSMPRYNFSIGLELWDTTEKIYGTRRPHQHDVKLSNGDTWSREYLLDLFSRLRVLHHLHQEILKVVMYTRIISNFCKQFDIRPGFINGVCPWDQDYFVKLSGPGVFPDSYTPFTKNQILDINHRNDQDIFILYDKIHSDYAAAGGINPAEWVNLYHSMNSDIIDVNFDGNHPGEQSNQLYFQQVKTFLETQ